MDYVYTVVFRIMANEDDTRDILQDTYLKIWEKRKSIKTEESLKPYLWKIAVNKCHDQLRKRKIRYEEKSIENDSVINAIMSDEQADKKLENDEALFLLKFMVSKLSPKQRIVFTMVELQELSHDEVSEITGMSKNSIKSNLNHARKRLDVDLRDLLK